MYSTAFQLDFHTAFSGTICIRGNTGHTAYNDSSTRIVRYLPKPGRYISLPGGLCRLGIIGHPLFSLFRLI